MDSVNIEQRMMVLEEKLEHQEYTMEKLNDVILDQQQQLDTLEVNLHRLRDMLQGSYDDIQQRQKEEPPPPHY
jgi:uncharacterized coiled-coil protein SlyX